MLKSLQSNTQVKTIATSLNQDSFFLQDPYHIINHHYYNYYFYYEIEIHSIKGNHQIKDCINALKNQTKIALFIIEHSKTEKLSKKCRYNYFRKQRNLNWCANLIYSLELLNTLPPY